MALRDLDLPITDDWWRQQTDGFMVIRPRRGVTIYWMGAERGTAISVNAEEQDCWGRSLTFLPQATTRADIVALARLLS